MQPQYQPDLTLILSFEAMGPEHRGRWGRGLGLLWKQKLTTGHRILPQAPAGQHPLPAPGLPEGASAPGHARCCPLGQQASAGSLWGDRTSLTKTTCSPAPPPSISCPETQPLRLEKTSDLDIRRGTESVPLARLRKGSYILFQLLITINQKNVSRL